MTANGRAPAPTPCPICLEAMVGDAVCVTACNHRFHSACIFEAVRRSQPCPLCRAPLVASPAAPPPASPAAPPSSHVRVLRTQPMLIDVEAESAASRRAWRNHQARLRRLRARSDEVRRAFEGMVAAERVLRDRHAALERTWSLALREALREAQAREDVREAKRARRRAVESLARHRRRYEGMVRDSLGMAPEREMMRYLVQTIPSDADGVTAVRAVAADEASDATEDEDEDAAEGEDEDAAEGE